MAQKLISVQLLALFKLTIHEFILHAKHYTKCFTYRFHTVQLDISFILFLSSQEKAKDREDEVIWPKLPASK